MRRPIEPRIIEFTCAAAWILVFYIAWFIHGECGIKEKGQRTIQEMSRTINQLTDELRLKEDELEYARQLVMEMSTNITKQPEPVPCQDVGSEVVAQQNGPKVREVFYGPSFMLGVFVTTSLFFYMFCEYKETAISEVEDCKEEATTSTGERTPSVHDQEKLKLLGDEVVKRDENNRVLEEGLEKRRSIAMSKREDLKQKAAAVAKLEEQNKASIMDLNDKWTVETRRRALIQRDFALVRVKEEENRELQGQLAELEASVDSDTRETKRLVLTLRSRLLKAKKTNLDLLSITAALQEAEKESSQVAAKHRL